MNTDRWYYRVFQGAPDLIRALLPGSAPGANALSLDPAAPGDRLYRFEALELKELSHRLDGVLWPRESTGCAETGSPEFPVVLLEVQMHPDSGFHHRLAAQTYRFLQHQPQIEHWAAQPAHPAGEARKRAAGLQSADPRQPPGSRHGCAAYADSTVSQAHHGCLIHRAQIMVIAGIPREEIRHTRAVQDWLAVGRQEGRQEGEAAVTLRLLVRRCGPLTDSTTTQIQALPLELLEALADALLDFQGPADLAAWLDANA